LGRVGDCGRGAIGKDRSPELPGVEHEVTSGDRKIAVKVVDIFGNDKMTIVEVTV